SRSGGSCRSVTITMSLSPASAKERFGANGTPASVIYVPPRRATMRGFMRGPSAGSPVSCVQVTLTAEKTSMKPYMEVGVVSGSASRLTARAACSVVASIDKKYGMKGDASHVLVLGAGFGALGRMPHAPA